MQRPPVVGIINSTPDIVDMLRVTFETAGFAVVSTFTYAIRDGEADIEGMMRQHDPRVIVYDIAPPYTSNWQLFQHIASTPAMQGRIFILTAMNRARVEELASGSGLPIFEIAETPHDLDALVAEVSRAQRASRTR
jgi:DNA-binding response OmpR family regulator